MDSERTDAYWWLIDVEIASLTFLGYRLSSLSCRKQLDIKVTRILSTKQKETHSALDTLLSPMFITTMLKNKARMLRSLGNMAANTQHTYLYSQQYNARPVQC